MATVQKQGMSGQSAFEIDGGAMTLLSAQTAALLSHAATNVVAIFVQESTPCCTMKLERVSPAAVAGAFVLEPMVQVGPSIATSGFPESGRAHSHNSIRPRGLY